MWQLLSLYTLPKYKEEGIRKDLYNEVFRWLRERQGYKRSSAKEVRVRLIIKPDNIGAIRLYKGLRF